MKKAENELRPPVVSELSLLLIVMSLVGFGLIMVYSTTGVVSQEKFGDSFFYVKKQIASALVGFALMAGLARINVDWLRRRSAAFLAIAIVLLVLPLLPGLGETAGGARRWVYLGGFRFQPAELVKISFVLFMAGYLSRHEHGLRGFLDGVLKPVLMLAPVGVLLLMQPDFGSAAVVALVTVAMAAAAGVRLMYVLYSGLLLASSAALLVILSPYRLSRVTSFLSPFNDAAGRGYQLIQSLIAIGTGGVSGVGLGDSQQKLFFLPAAHTDFIFSVVAEELGFIWAVVVIAAFLLFLWRGLKVASKYAEDTFCFSLSVGLTLLIVAPALLNIGVVTGMLPTKGMVLPFVGYGGSSLVTSLGTVGLLLALAGRFERPVRREKE